MAQKQQKYRKNLDEAAAMVAPKYDYDGVDYNKYTYTCAFDIDHQMTADLITQNGVRIVVSSKQGDARNIRLSFVMDLKTHGLSSFELNGTPASAEECRIFTKAEADDIEHGIIRSKGLVTDMSMFVK